MIETTETPDIDFEMLTQCFGRVTKLGENDYLLKIVISDARKVSTRRYKTAKAAYENLKKFVDNNGKII